MTFDMRTARLVALCMAVLPWAAACAQPRPIIAGCRKDTDCKGDRICTPRRPGSAQRLCSAPHPAPDTLARPAPETAGPAPTPTPPAGAPPFAMYGGNAQNTGHLAGPVPDQVPTQRWAMQAGDAIVGSPTIGPDGSIFVASHDGKLYALGPDGAQRWSHATGDRIWSTPAVTEDGTVYIGSDDDTLYALDGSTGALRWRFRVGQCDPPVGFGPEGVRCDVDGGPTLGPEGTIYVGGDGVYAIAPDGSLRWKMATAERVATAPALALPDGPHAGTVYAGCLDDTLYAIGPDGTRTWSFRTRGDIESSPAVGPDGTIYVGSDDDKVYALDPSGSLRWAVVTGGDVRASPAIGLDGTIYAGSYDGSLYAIAPSGDVKWRFATAGKIHAAPAIATNGTILVGSQDDHLYAVSPEGMLLWYIAFEDDVDAAPVVSGDGVIYAASDAGTLRAFR